MEEFKVGHLEIVCGPMFSGKSEELIRRMKRVQISNKSFLLFKPAIDNRYDVNHIVSHDKRKLDALITANDKAGLEKADSIIQEKNPEVVAFDEGNFYDVYLFDLARKWVKEGRRVIIAGLDTDFRGKPFGPMGDLMAVADFVDKLKGICMKCKSDYGTMTQRLIDGKPAKATDPTILVGGMDSYEVRCRNCHELAE